MNCKSLIVVFVSTFQLVGAQEYQFDAGNSEGWTFRLVNVTAGNEIRSGAATWLDNNNYPNVFTDSIGDSKGSAGSLVGSSDYAAEASAGDYLLLQVESPDLSSSPFWQATPSFSAVLLPAFTPDGMTPDILANMAVVVDDHDTGSQRSFVSGTASPMTPGNWSNKQFNIAAAFAAANPAVTNYDVVHVKINFYVKVASNRFVADPLFFVIDNVSPCSTPSQFSNEAEFRSAAGTTTTYGFESHGLSGDPNDLVPSPVPASDLAGNFDLAYTNLNAFNIAHSPGGACNADGDSSLFTHSVVASDYTLTFSNFGGENRAITAFGLTVCDFATGLTTPVTITFDTGTDSGTLLEVPSGQPMDTKNFVGIVVCPSAAFRSITLTFDDNSSGFQWFDEVIFVIDNASPCATPSQFSNEAGFRSAAGTTTTYGFESHGLSGDPNDLVPSPVPASDLAGNFDLAYTNLNAFNIAHSPGGACNADGDNSLFTHSVVASDYTLTFSNFGGENREITAFGLTVCDFATGLTTPVTITFDTGTDSGTLLEVPSGQPMDTKNFVGIVVCPSAAFRSITLTFDDNSSGFQWFDEVIFSEGGGGPVDPPPARPPLLGKSTSIEKTNQNLRGSPVVLGTVSLETPTSGTVLVHFNGNCTSSAGDRIVLAASDTTGWSVNDGHVSVEAADSDVNRHSFSHTRTYDVGPGSHTFNAVGQNYVEQDGSGVASVYGNLTATFFPARSAPNAAEPFVLHTGVVDVNHDVRGSVKGIAKLPLTAPAPGRVVVRFDGMCVADPGDLIVLAASDTVGWSVNAGNTGIEAIDNDLNTRVFSHTQSYPVGAGKHVFYGVAQNFVETAGDGMASFYASLTVEYYPDPTSAGQAVPEVRIAEVNETNLDVEGAPVALASVSYTAPAAGKIAVTFDCLCAGSPGDRIVMAASDTKNWSSNSGNVNVEAFTSDYNYNNASHTRVYDVAAGKHTYYAVAQNYVETGGTGVASFYGHLTLRYIPDSCTLAYWAGILQLGDVSPSGDEDGDGIPNELERAFGGHGGESSLFIAAGVPLLPEALIMSAKPGATFSMRFLQRIDHLGSCLTYRLQFSQNGKKWYNANTPGQSWTNTGFATALGDYPTPDGGTVRRVQVPMALPASSSVPTLLGRVLIEGGSK